MLATSMQTLILGMALSFVLGLTISFFSFFFFGRLGHKYKKALEEQQLSMAKITHILNILIRDCNCIHYIPQPECPWHGMNATPE